MLYLDYSRPAGGWIPNKHGGRENLDAIAFLRRFNTEVFGRYPERDHRGRGIDRLADGVAAGRLGRARLRLQMEHGVDARHPGLHQQGSDPPQASSRPDPVRPALRLLGELHPAAVARRGRARQSARSSAACRATTGSASPICAPITASCSAIPARSCCSWAASSARSANGATTIRSTGICWSDPQHAGVQALIRDLNQLYRDAAGAARARLRAAPASSGWSMHDADRSVFAWLRKGRETDDRCLVVVNFTPEVHRDYRIKVPFAGVWREVLNTDAAIYGGSNVGNAGAVSDVGRRRHPRGQPCHSAACCSFSRPGALACGSRPALPHPLGATWDGRGTNFALFSANADEGRALPVRQPGPARARAHRAARAHRGRLARLSPDVVARASSTAIACTAPTSRSTAIASMPHKLLIDPYAKRLAGRLVWSDAHFGYRAGSPRADLSFDRRDNARGMPKAVVVDEAFTWGDERRPHVPGKTRSSTRRTSRA